MTNRIEKQILDVLRRYQYADIGWQELNGYLHFPPVELIFSATHQLEKEGLIEEKLPPQQGYRITLEGLEYVQKHRLSVTILQFFWDKIFPSIITGFVGYIFGRLH